MAKIFKMPKIIITKAADVVADAADNVKDKASEGAVVIADKAGDTKDKIDKAWFGPVFSFEDISDTMPKVIHVADNQRMRNSDACDGAIGYKERIKGVKMMGLLPENIHLPGVKFYPNLDGLLYYRDPFNDHEYIDIDDYFDYLTERRVNEIKNVAHDLGAKHVRIVYKEEKKSIVSVDAKANASKKNKGIINADPQGTASAQHHHEKNNFCNIEVKAEVDYNDQREPVNPELIYLKNDPAIKSLIQRRMDGERSINKETYSIRCKTLNSMQISEAAKLDLVLKALKIGGNTSISSEAEAEERAYLEYTIEF